MIEIIPEIFKWLEAQQGRSIQVENRGRAFEIRLVERASDGRHHDRYWTRFTTIPLDSELFKQAQLAIYHTHLKHL
jgi:hypothetical protein